MKTKRDLCLNNLKLYLNVTLTALIFCLGASAQNYKPSAAGPILLTENDSVKALATDANKWRGNLPSAEMQAYSRNDRVVFFVTNIKWLHPKEDENAFFVYANVNGKAYRLTPESFTRVLSSTETYALGVKLYDERGFNGQLPAQGCASIQVARLGNVSNQARLALGRADICDDEKSVSSSTRSLDQNPATGDAQIEPNLLSAGDGDRIRLMEQATFGPNAATEQRLRDIGTAAWIEEQFNRSYPTFAYPNLALKSGDSNIGCPDTDPNRAVCLRDYYSRYPQQNHFFKEALYGDAQLRHRIVWALSQLWVTSGNTNNQGRWMEEYVKVLDRRAFGNYRDLMSEMTLNPAMGNFLDMIRSTRNSPNENYPREILQLFTVGVYELNQNGTLVRDAANNPIPTYDQARIDNFTRIFTGWTFCNVSTECPNYQSGIPNYIDPMRLVPGNHNTANSKALFNYPGAPNSTIAACTNCTTDANRTIYANDSLNRALDNIFHHPSLAPFVSKFLIQHLVTSDPTPAYVGRVAAAFINNGAGVRGDMKAVIRAILLDAEARGDKKTDPYYGKLREPVQFVTNILRQFDARSADRSQLSDGVLNGVTSGMGQSVFNPPSVFNYYSPDYLISVVPGTDVPGPEFGLMNTGTSFSRINFVNTIVFNRIAVNTGANIPLGTSIDVSGLQPFAESDPSGIALMEKLNEKLLHGVMSKNVKNVLGTAIQAVPESNPSLRVKQALYVVAQSSQFQIQK